MDKSKKILITLGDAAGIGPEVIVKTLSQISPEEQQNIEILGEIWPLELEATRLGLSLEFSTAFEENSKKIKVREFGLLSSKMITQGQINPKAGNAAYHYFVEAIEQCEEKKAAAIVTAPIHKEALNLAGHNFLGHTDILEKKLSTPTVMSLWHPKFIVSHVSDHVPLKEAINMVTAKRLTHVIEQTRNSLVKMGIKKPVIAVAGLNPHAGENGILGREEIDIIIPCLERLREKGYKIIGPVSGDTMYYSALKGSYQGLIAMYHDQGFAPMKTIDMPNCVNFTLGLPFVRTSPDHGTAFDLAGKGSADASSMLSALKLAQKLIA